MTTAKKFAVAGVSTQNGKTKIRFANDAMRVKILGKNGHTGVDLIPLPHEMTKNEIGQYLTSISYGSGNASITAAVAYVVKKNPAPAAVQATAVAAEAVTA
jgi:hypothetical protein